MMMMISVARQFFLYLQVKVDAARQLAMQSSLLEYFRRFLTKPSNMWLEIRSKIHDRMHLDLEARTQIFCAYNVNTGNCDDDNAPEIKYKSNFFKVKIMH